MTNEELKIQFDLNDPYQIAKYIKAVEKATTNITAIPLPASSSVRPVRSAPFWTPRQDQSLLSASNVTAATRPFRCWT